MDEDDEIPKKKPQSSKHSNKSSEKSREKESRKKEDFSKIKLSSITSSEYDPVKSFACLIQDLSDRWCENEFRIKKISEPKLFLSFSNPEGGWTNYESLILKAIKEKRQLEDDIHNLRREIADRKKKISELNKDSKDKTEKIGSLETDISSLESKEALRHLLDRVGPAAQTALLTGDKLRTLFKENESCTAYVMSIDLRRSTDLMLKAREPRLFAEFITSLADELRNIVLDNFGIFDKFTGDGVLAFFPDFFSGSKAGLLAVNAAEQCHELFERHYRRHRSSFISVLKDVGLGVGIDYGIVSLVQMQNELTVVGSPVVYACRLGGAEAGQTLVNQPAYEMLLANFSEFVDFVETQLEFKHEGAMVAYNTHRNEKEFSATAPDWLTIEGADNEE